MKMKLWIKDGRWVGVGGDSIEPPNSLLKHPWVYVWIFFEFFRKKKTCFVRLSLLHVLLKLFSWRNFASCIFHINAKKCTAMAQRNNTLIVSPFIFVWMTDLCMLLNISWLHNAAKCYTMLINVTTFEKVYCKCQAEWYITYKQSHACNNSNKILKSYIL